jgi:hypothetical protein
MFKEVRVAEQYKASNFFCLDDTFIYLACVKYREIDNKYRSDN